jgi:hypothetical protein
MSNKGDKRLSGHKRVGKTLLSPMHKLRSKMTAYNWSFDYLPNILWACLLSANMDRSEYLRLFRTVVDNLSGSNSGDLIHHHITHNFIADMPNEMFDLAFRDVISHPNAAGLLCSLAEIESLPDRHHWQRAFPDSSKYVEGSLEMAVGRCFDHQSIQATDVRWLKAIYATTCMHKVHMPPEMENLLLNYEHLDVREVGGFSRNTEMSFRHIEDGNGPGGPDHVTPGLEGKPPPHPPVRDAFWAEMLRNIDCIVSVPKENEVLIAATSDIEETRAEVVNHFHETIRSTGADPVHEGAFGLVLYCLKLAASACSHENYDSPSSRIIFRTMVETVITLRFLRHKNDITIWKQFRVHGHQQAQLAYLKHLDSIEEPEYMSKELLKELASEDMMMEFNDVKLGHWVDSNLRKLAEESSSKDIYDRYYDWSSSYTHGSWSCIRESEFTTCMNPLHRFHRVPSTRNSLKSVIPDVCKVSNLALEEINTLFPSFKRRIKAHKVS